MSAWKVQSHSPRYACVQVGLVGAEPSGQGPGAVPFGPDKPPRSLPLMLRGPEWGKSRAVIFLVALRRDLSLSSGNEVSVIPADTKLLRTSPG
jgi:hypothetical protein